LLPEYRIKDPASEALPLSPSRLSSVAKASSGLIEEMKRDVRIKGLMDTVISKVKA